LSEPPEPSASLTEPAATEPTATEPAATGPAVLPIGLRLAGRRVVVVGGGPVGLRRVVSLLDVGADVQLVAPEVVPTLHDLADRGRLTWHQRAWASGDLAAAWLAVACTDSPDINAAVVREADRDRVWCLRADDALAATAWFPAIGRTGPATVAVFAGRDPARAVLLRDAAVRAAETALRGGGAVGRVRPGSGRVVLVGGGPGDPGLLTRRGYERLAEADVVVVDRLAPLPALEGLHPEVEVVDVSKVPRGPFTPQERINEILIAQARAGRVVVRLKGGDPYVFGRGMEELIACTEAGVAVEVVPGVTSAVAVPALAGVPVTHRGLSQGFSVVSGHLPPDHPQSTLDWGALARGGTTLVALMAVHSMPAIAAELLAQGMDPTTEVVVVQDGGSPSMRVCAAPLSDVADLISREQVRPPAVVVIGPVAGLARAGP
jgi:uroporphyrin-III C-methyltransferase / precorrin-2 dehydrogenase / sirohydrochlorin ferrochelatase